MDTISFLYCRRCGYDIDAHIRGRTMHVDHEFEGKVILIPRTALQHSHWAEGCHSWIQVLVHSKSIWLI